jgi:hypothetical protein
MIRFTGRRIRRPLETNFLYGAERGGSHEPLPSFYGSGGEVCWRRLTLHWVGINYWALTEWLCSLIMEHMLSVRTCTISIRCCDTDRIV